MYSFVCGTVLTNATILQVEEKEEEAQSDENGNFLHFVIKALGYTSKQ
jgi:hypothetical protein